MTKADYIALVNKFGLEYHKENDSAYYKEYPICGYRIKHSTFGKNDWDDRCLIIFDNYSEELNNTGHYSGFYTDKYARTVEDARQLIMNQIMVIKDKYMNERLANMKKDF